MLNRCDNCTHWTRTGKRRGDCSQRPKGFGGTTTDDYQCRAHRPILAPMRPTPNMQPIRHVEVIGARIRAARESAGMSREDVATAAGVSAGTVGRVECGDGTSVETLALIVSALGGRFVVSFPRSAK